MKFRDFVLAAGLSLVLTGAATAATVLVSEGKRDQVKDAIDLGDSPPVGVGYDLDALGGGPFGAGDTIGIYGRIVYSLDRFTYSFTLTGGTYRVAWDFDGYDLEAGGSVSAALSGLVDEAIVDAGGDPLDPGGKGVRIAIEDGGGTEILSRDYTTNVSSVTGHGRTIFGSIGPGTYTLVVDGSVGPHVDRPALYDIELTAIPLPAGGLLLLTALGGMGAARRFRKS